MSFLAEIKRRKIFQVAVVYAVVAWLIIQIVSVIESPLLLPGWFDTAIIVLLAIGFPITLIMSWGFNLTSEGVVREGSGNDVASISGFKIEYLLFGVIVLALAWLVYRVEFDNPEIAVEPTGPSEPAQKTAAETLPDILPNSIAVLPCDNLSLDPEDAYFAAGIHESTLNQLAKIRDLIVIARTSVLQYADNPQPIPEIASALRVETVMECSVRYADGRVLITAQLINGQSGAHLWSDEYNRELTKVFAVQAEVARQIAAELHAKLLPDEQARINSIPTESEEAYEHYLHALSYPDVLYYPQYLPARIEALEKAIELDPDFVDAYVELSYALYWARQRDLALEYARKAVELDPMAARGYHRISRTLRYYYRSMDEARAALERAIELGPGDRQTNSNYAVWLAEIDTDYDGATRYGERSTAIDPLAEESHFWLGYIYIRTGEYTKAISRLKEAIRLDPSELNSYWMLANAEYMNGEPAAAKANLDKAVEMTAHVTTDRLGYIAYLYGLLGEADLAEQATDRLRDSRDNPYRGSFGYLRWAALGTRDKEQALQAWDEVISGYLNDDQPVSPGTISRFRDNWLNDPILEEPEFVELRRRVGYEG